MYVPKDFPFVDVLEKAHAIKGFFPIGLTAIVVDPLSPVRKTVSDYYKKIAVLKTQRVVQVFNSINEAEAWLSSVTGVVELSVFPYAYFQSGLNCLSSFGWLENP